MKVFVAGGTGVVGRRAVPALVADGHEVTAVARGDERSALVGRLGASPVAVDLFDRDEVGAAVAGHDAVVNLATNIPPVSKAGRRSAWAVNDRLRTEAATNLAAGALAADAERYVQESICFPYLDGGSEWIDEDHPADHTPWGYVSAGAAEATTRRFSDEGGVGVVLRFAQFQAADAMHTGTVETTVRWRLNPWMGDPDGYTSTIQADDAGSAVAAALRAPAGTFNVGDDEPLKRRDAGEAVAAALGVRPPKSLPRWVTRLAPASMEGLLRSQRISNARFKAATGWSPKHPTIRGDWPRDPGEGER